MKKAILFIFISVFYSVYIISQPCLSEGISFYSQSDIDYFPINYPECNEILGNVVISGADINNLNGLNALVSIGGDLLIESNDVLIDLTGLENLESISGSLLIGNTYFNTYPYCNGNPSLTSLTGLNSLSHIDGSLKIYCNNNLTSLAGLNNLTNVEGNLHIGSIDYIYGFKFGNDSLLNLSGLNMLLEVGGIFTVAGNDNLVNFEGLNNLVSIGGNFWTAWNDALEDFLGLEQLATVGGSIDIRKNNSLTSLNGLENLASLQDGLKIGGNYDGNQMLSDLTALYNLTNIGGDLEIRDNDELANLSGLNNIEAGSIEDLTIVNNSSLTYCEILSICQYLTSPNGTTSIYNNAEGCSSVEELELLCGVSINENTFLNDILILPNPFHTSATIEYELTKRSNVQLTIYDYLGKQVEVIEKKQAQGKQQIVWNAEGLPAGVYHFSLHANMQMSYGKLILVK